VYPVRYVNNNDIIIIIIIIIFVYDYYVNPTDLSYGDVELL
jgi:hypothetical protein